jgi:hypothetical protein
MMPLNLGGQNTLRDIIDYDHLKVTPGLQGRGTLKSTEQLLDLLYEPNDLNMDLNEGFKGNPGIGTVVFAKLGEQQNMSTGSKVFSNRDFNAFVSDFNSNDRIFVIGSIFGGTGASALPWLLKTFRQPNANNAALQTAPIGVLSVMPYFQVSQNASSKIDSRSFITRTKSALRYYVKNLAEPNLVYYVGDDNQSIEHNNVEGGVSQNNPAHAVEMVGALSILHFLGVEKKDIPAQQKPYRFGMNLPDNERRIYPNMIDNTQKTYRILNRPLTQFYLANLLHRRVLPIVPNINWKLNSEIIKKISGGIFARTEFDQSFLQTSFFSNLTTFMNRFTTWLGEVGGEGQTGASHTTFNPFVVEPNIGDAGKLDGRNAQAVNELIQGRPMTEQEIVRVEQKGIWTIYWTKDKRIPFNELAEHLNRIAINMKSINANNADTTKSVRYAEILYQGTQNFLDENRIFMP